MVFEVQRTNAREVLYPAALFAIVVFALVGLGVYQWLSTQAERSAETRDRAAARDEDARGGLARAESDHAISADDARDDDDDSRDCPGHRDDRP